MSENLSPHSYRTAATLMRDILDGIEALLAERPMLAAVRVGSTTLGNQRAELKARLNELQPDGPKGEQDAGALAIEFVEQHPCPRWPNATALKCAKKGEEYPRCRYCDAARAIRRTPATHDEGSK